MTGGLAQTWVELILDASGSMYNTLEDGRYRIAAAKDVLATFIAGLPPEDGLHVGLRVYGSELQATHADACTDSKLFVPMSGVDKPALLQTVDRVLARGATPIAWSLEQAGNDFTQPGEYLVILVTDGEESCGGGIQQVMAGLTARGIDIDLRVIGFDLTEQASRSFDGAGTFENARSAEELAAALGRAVSGAVAVPADVTHPLVITLTRGGVPATEGTVVSLTSAVNAEQFPIGSTGPGRHEGSLTAGTYIVVVQDAYSDAALTFSGITITPEGPNEFSFELAASFEVQLNVISAPAFVGQTVTVSWRGAGASGEHGLTIVPVAAPDNSFTSAVWVSGESGTVAVPVVGEPGLLEARYLLQLPTGGMQVAGRSAPFEASRAAVSLYAPAEVAAGSTFEVGWTAPGSTTEFIAVVALGSEAHEYGIYRDLVEGNPLVFRAPDVPGDYELRYLNANTEGWIHHSQPLKVVAVDFALTAPASVEAASYVQVHWLGPDGPGDYISVAPAGADQYVALQWEYTASGNPLTLLAPGTPGAYEIRYSSDSADHAVLFSTELQVTPLAITLDAPASVTAGSSFSVEWTGPDGEYDYITIVPVDASDGAYMDYAYTDAGSPALLIAPDEPGEYEIRYASDSRPGTFARRAIQVR